MTTHDLASLSIVIFLGVIAPWALLNIYGDNRQHRSLRVQRHIRKIPSNPHFPMSKTGFTTSNPNWLDTLHEAVHTHVDTHEAELKRKWDRLSVSEREAHTWDINECKKILRAIEAGSRDG